LNITHAVRKFQIIQRKIDHIEIRLVVISPLSQKQEFNLIHLIKKNLDFHSTITITYHENIAPGPMGKYEEFIGLDADSVNDVESYFKPEKANTTHG